MFFDQSLEFVDLQIEQPKCLTACENTYIFHIVPVFIAGEVQVTVFILKNVLQQPFVSIHVVFPGELVEVSAFSGEDYSAGAVRSGRAHV